jgi:excinuclease ABC subunit C
MGYNLFMDIATKMKRAPSSPGVYLMKDQKGKIIYVGKAKNLKNRLKSYFQMSTSLDARKTKMVKEVRDFDYVVTKNELEALVLEANFIKKTRPRYNIILRDDKNYPYIKLTVNERWPRLGVSRKVVKDGSLYFGPYVPAGNMWEILKFIRCHFLLPSWCLAPCSSSMRTESDHKLYMEMINDVRLFLTGGKKELFERLGRRMRQFSGQLRFEEAAKLRDRLKAMERVWETQRVISQDIGDVDVIGLYRENKDASVFILFVRSGTVVGQKDFMLKRLNGISDREIIINFLEQFYSGEILPPPKIILPLKNRFKTLKQWLRSRRESVVRISSAGGDREMEILGMAQDNARYSFLKRKDIRVSGVVDEEIASLKKLLNMKTVPVRIEAVDVSNISGSEAVGAVVVWEKGEFKKDDYRLFKIKTVKGIDDFAMIGEVVGRHVKHISGNAEKLPQLILIDGGKGQLESALKAVKPYDLTVEVAAIAKAGKGQTDRIFLNGGHEPVPLEPFIASTRLLQRIRDEAHRFAVGFHKKLRKKRTLESPLEKIYGIGKKRRLLLLREFGTIEAIRRASVDEIASLKGMNKKTAIILKEKLRGTQ